MVLMVWMSWFFFLLVSGCGWGLRGGLGDDGVVLVWVFLLFVVEDGVLD